MASGILKLKIDAPGEMRAVQWTGSNFSDIVKLQGFLQSVGVSISVTDNGDGTLTAGGGTLHTDDWLAAVPRVLGQVPGVDWTIVPTWVFYSWAAASGTGQYLSSL